eukprot:6553904-Lingulodinium_polyedra.AAC.1
MASCGSSGAGPAVRRGRAEQASAEVARRALDWIWWTMCCGVCAHCAGSISHPPWQQQHHQWTQ